MFQCVILLKESDPLSPYSVVVPPPLTGCCLLAVLPTELPVRREGGGPAPMRGLPVHVHFPSAITGARVRSTWHLSGGPCTSVSTVCTACVEYTVLHSSGLDVLDTQPIHGT